MTPYALAVLSLLLAVAAFSIAAALAAWRALRGPGCRGTLFLSIGFVLLAITHVYSLELAVYSGLFDLRQSLLAAGVAVLLLAGLAGIRR